MSLLSNFFAKNTLNKTEQLLSTGESNWRYKPNIIDLIGFANFVLFLKELEDSFNIQLGLHSATNEKNNKAISFRLPIYNEKSQPEFWFLFTIIQLSFNNEIAFSGLIGRFLVISDLIKPNKNNFIIIQPNKNMDLSVIEYNNLFFETLSKSLTIQNIDSSNYFIYRKDKGKCFNKSMEEITRNKQK